MTNVSSATKRLDQALAQRANLEYVHSRLENIQEEITLLNVTGSEPTNTEMIADLREDRLGLLSRLESPLEGSDLGDAARLESLRDDIEELIASWASFYELRATDSDGALFQLLAVADPGGLPCRRGL